MQRTLSGALLAILLAPLAATAEEPQAGPGLRYYYPLTAAPKTVETDVCVYGGTAGGVAAALQAARMGKKAVLVVFGRNLGGMTTGGLSATDGGSAAGGIAREFYKRVGRLAGFNPDHAQRVLRAMLQEAKVLVLEEHRLLGVRKDGSQITALATDAGTTVRARMFIDATYEGDLLAGAGVSYHVGREANKVYGETINGIRPPGAHNFTLPVDPYRVEGDRSSGLVSGVSDEPYGTIGDGDRRVQAYNFRMHLLPRAKGGLPFPRPRPYDPERYTLLLRYLKAGAGPGSFMQRRVGDSNNQGGFSTDNIGRNYDWPDGPARGDRSVKKDAAYFKHLYEIREAIFQDHVSYQQGVFYFLTNDERVPPAIREEVNRWGLAPDCFAATGHWPHELYVREGRRLLSDFVMTQHQCSGRQIVPDSVGLAQYTMDSHNVRRLIVNGKVKNEGDVQTGIPGPYPVAYRALVPKEAECTNLLVPVCVSSSHIAYGSIRMEPVFMVLGQSAATAAALAIDAGVPVQKVDYPALRARLLQDNQVLEWTGPRKTGGRAAVKLAGIVVDDDAAQLTGEWVVGIGSGRHVGPGYRHDGNEGRGQKTATFTARLPRPGRYEVRLAYSTHPNRATNVPVTVKHEGGPTDVRVNQRKAPPIDNLTISLGTFRFGTTGTVIVSNAGTDGYVIIDAVQFLPAE